MLLFALASVPATSQGRGAAGAGASGRGRDPAPRLPNGKPSMAGVWDNTRRADVTNKAIPGFVKELPYTAWGKAKWDGYDNFMQTNGDYVGNCLPFGMSRSIYGPHPLQIIHDNDHLVMLFEQNSMFHIVPTDGRPFTKDLPAVVVRRIGGALGRRHAGGRDRRTSTASRAWTPSATR